MNIDNKKRFMKKFLTSVTTAGAFLAAAPQALALDICPTGAGDICSGLGEPEAIIKGILNFIFVVIVIVCLFYLVWGGFKWITSQGEKAGVEGARSQIINALIGLVLVFLSYIILNIVLQFFGLELSTLELPKGIQ